MTQSTNASYNRNFIICLLGRVISPNFPRIDQSVHVFAPTYSEENCLYHLANRYKHRTENKFHRIHCAKAHAGFAGYSSFLKVITGLKRYE